jgi:hypothetical protein
MVLLGLFTVETVIADSCDGDSSGAVTVSDGSSRNANPGTTPAAPGKAPSHSMHVCHCAHAHAGSLRIGAVSPERPEHPATVEGESVRTPSSVSPEPRLRPPLA